MPIASKKFENSSVNRNMMSATTLTRCRSKPKSTAPMRLKSGSATMPPANPKSSPNGQIALTIAARTVPPTSAMRIAPFTRSAMRTPPISSVRTNSSVGRDATEPPTPRSTGGDGLPVAVTKPALTKPMKAMKSPMPTVMASFSCTGTASKIIFRRPVAASRTMITPLMTTSAIASGQLIEPTIENARNALMPRPAAKANGRRVTRPNSTVMTPAVSAVAAATALPERTVPSTSGVERMRGLRMTM